MNESEMKSGKNISYQYKWGDDCSGWVYHKSSELTVIRESMPQGTSEKLHYHKNTVQFFYIISGTAEITIDGKAVLISADEGCTVNPGQIHSIKNAGNSELEFIVISHPDSHQDRIDIQTSTTRSFG